MRSGYRITWTDNALEELRKTIEYIRLNFSQREVDRLAERIESVVLSISKFPRLYPETARYAGVRRAVVARLNTMYYRIDVEDAQIKILSFFSNRDDPEKLDI